MTRQLARRGFVASTSLLLSGTAQAGHSLKDDVREQAPNRLLERLEEQSWYRRLLPYLHLRKSHRENGESKLVGELFGVI